MTLNETLTRTEGSLVFEYRAGSHAEERLETVAEGYREALARITAFLGKQGAALPTIRIHLWDLPREAGPPSADGRGKLEAFVQFSSESPGPPPEIVLTPLVLEALLGPGQPSGRFWEDGLAGYLAAEGGSAAHGEAPGRVAKLREEGQLQALADSIHQRAERHSPLAATVATAFALYLVPWRGAERFRRLVQEARAGREDAIRRVYGQPLQAVEGRWLRDLEATSQTEGGSIRAAVRDVLPYFREYRGQLLAILAIVLVGMTFDLFTPLALRFLVDNILGRAPLGFPLPGLAAAGERIAPDGQIPALLMLLAAMVSMFLVNAAARIRQTYLLATVSEGVNLDLRRRFFHHLQRLPVSFHAHTSATDVSQRFFTDIAQVPAALSTGLAVVSSAISMVLFGSTILSLNVWLGLVAIAGLPFFALASRQGRAAIRQAMRERGRRSSEMQQALFESLASQRFLRQWGGQAFAMRRFDERLEVNRELNVRMMLLSQLLARATVLITNGAQVAVLIVGGLIIVTSGGASLSPGGLMAFYVLLLRLYVPAGSFAGAFQSFIQASDSLARLRHILELPVESEPPKAIDLGPLRQELRFEELRLARTKGSLELASLTAEVAAGSKVAFVGPTGSGKASLIGLLSRFDDPTGGVIRWDGTDISGASRASLRAQMTVLTQETFVLNATLYDNLRLGRPQATEGEVAAAVRAAGLSDFVASLPGGYDTVVSDRDPTLSTPIRQRLAVARALLREASLIVVEDATSALEAHAQRELEAALRGGKGSPFSVLRSPFSGEGRSENDGVRTLIRIAERLGTIADADRIYVLEDGRVVENGTHDELLERQGLYEQLLREEAGEAAVSGALQAVRRLGKLEPFSSLPPEVLEQVAKLLLYMEREPGQEIVRQGTVGDELFVIGRGGVEISVSDEEGNERVVNTLSEGDYFGEISFLRRTPRTANVKATAPTELHVLRRIDFDSLLAQLGEGMLTQMEETARKRVADTRAKLAALSG